MNKLTTAIITIGIALFVTACASPNGTNRIVLPLDHGPRAQTTPWENKQRFLRAETEVKAASEKPASAVK